MSSTVTLAEAQAKLPELVRQLAPGEEIAITDGDETVATLAPKPPLRIEPLVRQWHWDTMPLLYVGGGIGGGVCLWRDWNPLIGFGIGFGIALAVLSVVLAALRPELENATH